MSRKKHACHPLLVDNLLVDNLLVDNPADVAATDDIEY